jgi:ribonuclease HI
VEKTIDKVTYKSKLVRVQRLVNIRSAKAYRAVSNKSLCILTGLNPIDIKVEEAFQFYHLNKGSTKEEALVDRDMEVKYCHHPTEMINFLTENNEETSTIQMFTDGSKSEQGVGAGVAIFKSGTHIKSLKYKLNKKMHQQSSRATGDIESTRVYRNLQTEDKMTTIYTDSRMTLVSLKSSKIHTFLIEEMRRKLMEMEKINWKVQLCWVKAHVGIQENKLADTLAKEAATNADIIECYKKVPKSVVISELGEISVEKWQREWDQTTKGKITKEYLPIVADRLNMKINITHNFTSMVTGHGNIRS